MSNYEVTNDYRISLFETEKVKYVYVLKILKLRFMV